MTPATQIYVLGAWVDPITQTQAVAQIVAWAQQPQPRLIVTPNLDPCRILQQPQSGLAVPYAAASLTLADGWPLVWASRLTGTPLPQRVTGADLVWPICEAAAQLGLRVYFIGGSEATLTGLRTKIARELPSLAVAGMESPPFGFDRDAQQNAALLARLRAARPQIIFLALGTPRQEKWLHTHLPLLGAGVGIGVGAALDFIAGTVRRAPVRWQRANLEWLWRMKEEPRRLSGRYLRMALALPRLLWLQWRAHQRGEGVRLRPPNP